MRPQKASLEGQQRVSTKVKKLIDEGEYPNTPAGRKQAVAVSYSMLRAGRLGPRGQYRRKKR